jgi:hypothetical protein
MCPCTPVDISIPDGPGGPTIPGFGQPFAGLLPNLNPFPPGFPEDLLGLMNRMQLLIPPGALKSPLNPNYGKDVFDNIIKLLDQFMPFLMLYKFFLPILNIIICIIEVLCALLSPFKLPGAISRLFKRCIPDFLNMFPIFALIIMIISLIILLLAMIQYIIEQILKFVLAILRNIEMLTEAFQESPIAVLAIAQKLGTLLCIFQNLFVLLTLFSVIIQVIKEILSLSFAIPPCDDTNGSDSGCCTADVCPIIVKNGEYTKNTGTFKYLNVKAASNSIDGLPSPFNQLLITVRQESWQLYDINQSVAESFRNIIDGYDVPVDRENNPPPFFKNIFFPTDARIDASTTPKQAPYIVNLRVFYNPMVWNRTGVPRYIRFTNCIVQAAPTLSVSQYDNSSGAVGTGVFNLLGGLGYEDDGVTALNAFTSDGITEIVGQQATLQNFIHMAPSVSSNPIFFPTDGYQFENITYTFKPNTQALLRYNLITLGCMPDVALPRNFINTVYAGDIALKTKLLTDIVSGANFPDTLATQQCLSLALDALRNNMTVQGVADFQTAALLCLQKLQNDANKALGDMVGVGFDPCKSSYSITPPFQFTTKPIALSVELKERNGISVVSGLSPVVAENIAARLKAHATFGTVSKFVYDGYQTFTANLSSDLPGSGKIMLSFDNQTFCTNVNDPPSHTLQEKSYKFVYASAGLTTPVAPSATGDISDGTQPRRDEGDQSRDSGGGS